MISIKNLSFCIFNGKFLIMKLFFKQFIAHNLDKLFFFRYNTIFKLFAGLAQLVEQLPCKQQVGGSSPLTSSIILAVFDQNITISLDVIFHLW